MCVPILRGRDAALWLCHRVVILPWRKEGVTDRA